MSDFPFDPTGSTPEDRGPLAGTGDLQTSDLDTPRVEITLEEGLLLDRHLPMPQVTARRHLVIDADEGATSDALVRMDLAEIESPVMGVASALRSVPDAVRGVPERLSALLSKVPGLPVRSTGDQGGSGAGAGEPGTTGALGVMEGTHETPMQPAPIDPASVEPASVDPATSVLGGSQGPAGGGRLPVIGSPGERGWVALGQTSGTEVAMGAIGRLHGAGVEMRDTTGMTPQDFTSFSEEGWIRLAVGFTLTPYGRQRTLVSVETRVATSDTESARAVKRAWGIGRPLVDHMMSATLSTLAERAEGPRAAMGTADPA